MVLEFVEAWFGFVQDVQCPKIFPGNDQQQVFIGRGIHFSPRVMILPLATQIVYRISSINDVIILCPCSER
jgi:hypothetical protein